MADFDYLTAIAENSSGFANAAEGNLDASVSCCPGWNVADLVWHLSEVHWFWATIVDERLSAPPDESRRPGRPAREELIGGFRRGAERLVHVLERTPDDASVWTWAPAQQDAAFVTRHQVQESAVHRWDAVNARGERFSIPVAEATDSIDEFLTFSVSSEADPAEPPRPPLGGRLALVCTDAEVAWTVEDGAQPGTVRFRPGADPDLPAVRATGSDLLLWLYGRVEIALREEAAALAGRLRALSFTD